MQKINVETFYPSNRAEWREWLRINYRDKNSIWILQYKKQAGIPSISWSDAVSEALCFGWIDSTRKSIGNDQFIQFFTKRKPKSAWSKVNKDKVEQLISDGLMTYAGFQSIATAKQNGSWTLLDSVETLEIPADLLEALNDKVGAYDYFISLSRSLRKSMLQWIVFAKRPETRSKRVSELATLAAVGQKPKQF